MNSRFQATGNGKTAWLTLTSVEDWSDRNPTPNTAAMAVAPRRPPTIPPETDTFVLHFASTDGSLTQDTYSISHSALGDFDLFLAPEGRLDYAAVISRVTRQPRR